MEHFKFGVSTGIFNGTPFKQDFVRKDQTGASILSRDKQMEQGHHHNGGQAARRPQMMCSTCGRRFATRRFGVRGGLDELIG